MYPDSQNRLNNGAVLRPYMSLVLGDFGEFIGEVAMVTIPDRRLDLYTAPSSGYTPHVSASNRSKVG
jgi:hypothetical protein